MTVREIRGEDEGVATRPPEGSEFSGLELGVSKSVKKALSGGHIDPVWDHLDYNPEDLKKHLESRFKSGMDWSNYGKCWVVGHVIPKSSLPYSDFGSDNFKKCWSLLNLRPMKNDENLKKSSVFCGKRYDKYSNGHISEFVIKPWGAELIWMKTAHYVGKILFVTEGSMLSLQHHKFKEETMYVKSGMIKIHHGTCIEDISETLLMEDDSFHIPPGTIHRVEALVDSNIFEVSTPQLDDIVRHMDEYGRLNED